MNKLNSSLWPILASILLLALALFTIQITNHLFPWDERFHALVALNLSKDLSFPMLYPHIPFANFNSSAWPLAEAWLHKPPLFSYQMAFWMRMLGDEIWVMRLNSALMFYAFAFALYKIARIYGHSRALSTLMAGAFSLSPLFFSLISGRMGMDHNDISFLGHIALSYYFLELFKQKRRWPYALAIGLFSAAALLTKWLPGLLVYLSFGLWALNSSLKQNSEAKRLWRGFIMALGLCLLLGGAWHLYAYILHPQEWLVSMNYSRKHFGNALEGHHQAWYFHLKIWLSYYSVPLLLSAVYLLKAKKLSPSWPYWFSFAFVLLFFSLAKTKLPAYTIIALVPLYVGLQHANLPEKGWKLQFSALMTGIALLISSIQINKLYQASLSDPESKVADFYRDLATALPENSLLFNLPRLEYPQAMYYIGQIAFDFLPPPRELRRLQSEGYAVFVLKDTGQEFDQKAYKAFESISYRP